MGSRVDGNRPRNTAKAPAEAKGTENNKVATTEAKEAKSPVKTEFKNGIYKSSFDQSGGTTTTFDKKYSKEVQTGFKGPTSGQSTALSTVMNQLPSYSASKTHSVSTTGYQQSASYKNGAVQADATVKVGDARASATTSATFKGGKAEASVKAEASATLVDASATARVGDANNNVTATGTAYAGAKATGSATAGVDLTKGTAEAKAEGNLFVGARAQGTVSTTVAGGILSATAKGEVSAGLGIGGNAGISFQDGKLTISAGARGTVGVGGGLSGSVTLDVNKLRDVAVDKAKEIGSNVLNTIGGWFRN
jgi:hypothetical protein